MKLTFKHLDLHLAHTWAIARNRGVNTANVAVAQLSERDGTVGLGEAAPVARYGESIDSVKALLKRIDTDKLSFDDIASSMAYLDALSPRDMSAKCAINLALLDGAAKRVGKPACEFLGLGFKEKNHITSFTIGIADSEVVRHKVLQAGRYPVLKVKVGVPGDKENLRALREVAPDKQVRADANEGWKTKEQALEMIEWLAQDKNIQFVEQPMPADAPLKDWVWLKKHSPLPIFGDESYHLAQNVERCAECFHGANIKLVKAGGLTAGLAALQAARKYGLKTMVGCMIETSILISAAAHLAELCDYLDLDGNLLITNDPYLGVTAVDGILSFANAPQENGLRVTRR